MNTNRRQMLQASLAVGATGGLASNAFASNQQEEDKPDTSSTDDLTPDQKFVMEAGMTREEADCWLKTAEAAGAFFKLPRLHPTDAQEVAQAIHVIQNKLLGRPTYRKYLKLAKAAHEKRKEDK